MIAQQYLSKKGKKIFDEIVKHLEHSSMPIDSHIISQAAHCLDLLNESSEAIKDGGAYQSSNSGYRQVSPEFTTWKAYNDRFEKLIKELGLSPAAREKIAAFSEHKEDLPVIE